MLVPTSSCENLKSDNTAFKTGALAWLAGQCWSISARQQGISNSTGALPYSGLSNVNWWSRATRGPANLALKGLVLHTHKIAGSDCHVRIFQNKKGRGTIQHLALAGRLLTPTSLQRCRLDLLVMEQYICVKWRPECPLPSCKYSLVQGNTVTVPCSSVKGAALWSLRPAEHRGLKRVWVLP